jgi:2-methylcitrate dehydratase PrpD
MGVLGALGWLTAVVACSLLLDSASAAAAVTAKPKMATHQAFLNAGKTAGLEIWRIEVRFKQPIAYL